MATKKKTKVVEDVKESPTEKAEEQPTENIQPMREDIEKLPEVSEDNANTLNKALQEEQSRSISALKPLPTKSVEVTEPAEDNNLTETERVSNQTVRDLSEMYNTLKEKHDAQTAKDENMQKKEASRQMIYGLGDTMSALSNLFTVGEGKAENIGNADNASRFRQMADKARGERAAELKDIARRLDYLQQGINRARAAGAEAHDVAARAEGARAEAERKENKEDAKWAAEMAQKERKMAQDVAEGKKNRESRERTAGIRSGFKPKPIEKKVEGGKPVFRVPVTDNEGKSSFVTVDAKSYDNLLSSMVDVILQDAGLDNETIYKYDDAARLNIAREKAYLSPRFNSMVKQLAGQNNGTTQMIDPKREQEFEDFLNN